MKTLLTTFFSFFIFITLFAGNTKDDPSKKSQELLNKASEKIQKEDFKGALKDLNEAITLKPDYFEGFFNRATLKMNTNDLQGALQDYDEANKLKPDHAGTLLNRAAVKAKMKDYAAGIEDLNTLLEQKPHYGKAYTARGQMKRLNKEIDEACGDFASGIIYGDKAGDRQYGVYCIKNGKAPIQKNETFDFSFPDSMGFQKPTDMSRSIVQGYYKKNETMVSYTVKAERMTRTDLVNMSIEDIAQSIFEESKVSHPLSQMEMIAQDEKMEFPFALYFIKSLGAKKKGNDQSKIFHIIKGYKAVYISEITYNSLQEREMSEGWLSFFKDLQVEYK